MTREEIIEIAGDEEQADYAIDILLEQIKLPFLQSAIKSRINEIESELEKLKEEGYVWKNNGSWAVDWSGCLDKSKQFDADILICRLNRTKSLMCVRS